ncbi:MAG TPA: hypothetical protein VFQ61_31890 [Polyangiaceae bacterium]|nr:hypothetical protein [Polyangiaceae bacterium]
MHPLKGRERHGANPPLPWESNGGLPERLWGTALLTSVEPQRAFGELPEGKLGPAFTFAVIAELYAIGSVTAFLILSALVIDAEFTRVLLSNPLVTGVTFGVTLGLSVIMVLLHALWGVTLEFGLRTAGRHANYVQGIRFGLYACGWDLLTSPAGIAQGLLSRGLWGAWGPIRAAVGVPRSALHAYVTECRKLDISAARRGLRFSLAILVVSLVGFALLTIVAIALWLL